MSKPMLSQMVEVAKQQGHFIGIVKDGKYHCVKCGEAVEMFGDVEVKDLGFTLSEILFSKACNELKVTIKVFI